MTRPGELDEARLREALALAEQSVGLSEPNPRVGCILGDAQGHIFGRGFTQQAGGPHAEVQALREAAASGAPLEGATAWVTLEPCAHHGRTPPCADALVQARVDRVVVAVRDPYPHVNGAGLARLRAAGIDVCLAEPQSAVAVAARELNIGFHSRMERGRPWVRLKAAVSLDGRMALPDGQSQWITGEAARIDAHAWRRRAGAIVTGVGTVVADDPRLDVRLVPTTVQPWRVVLDPAGRTPVSARLLQAPGKVMLVHGHPLSEVHDGMAPDSVAERLHLPVGPAGFDLRALLDELARRQVNELHLEGGPRFNGRWLEQGLVDELLVYVAPMLLGHGLPLADLPLPGTLGQVARWQPLDLVKVGQDLRWRLRQQAVSNHLTTTPPGAGDGA